MALSTSPMSILAIIKLTTEFISRTTAYLSTLPYPIEPLEELISCLAVISNLLSALQLALDRFPDLVFSPSLSFLNPLSHDIQYAISQLDARVEDAKRSKIFQPNDLGLVQLPRNAWIFMNGTEAKAASLRSRLYVEKYRARVLIDTITWYGLRFLESRNVEEEREYQILRNRLGLVTERLVGVWSDYTPRLKALENAQQNFKVGNPFSDPDEVEKQRNLQRALQLQMMNQAQAQAQAQQQMQAMNQPPRCEATPEQMQQQQKIIAQQQAQVQVQPEIATTTSTTTSDEKESLKQSTSCVLCTSHDTKYETHLLRQNAPIITFQTTTLTTLLGLSIFRTKTAAHSPPGYYTKPLPSSLSEICVFRTTSQGTLSDSQHEGKIQRCILALPEDAQWEVQKLVESRESATSGRNVRREWKVVGVVERCRRKVNHGNLRRGGWWWERRKGIDKRDQKEWILVLRGETVDCEERIVPVEGSNPWEKEKKEEKKVDVAEMQARQSRAQQQAAQQQSVLRYVEQRRTMSVEEAEKKMDEMLKDIFKFEESESYEEDSDDEDKKEEELMKVDSN